MCRKEGCLRCRVQGWMADALGFSNARAALLSFSKVLMSVLFLCGLSACCFLFLFSFLFLGKGESERREAGQLCKGDIPLPPHTPCWVASGAVPEGEVCGFCVPQMGKDASSAQPTGRGRSDLVPMDWVMS